MHHAELVWVTPDAEKLIGKIARVSNPNNEDNPNVEGLIRYLINLHLVETLLVIHHVAGKSRRLE